MSLLQKIDLHVDRNEKAIVGVPNTALSLP
jgi:hypothetical protein